MGGTTQDPPKMFLVNVTEKYSRRHFREHFLKCGSISLFFNIDYRQTYRYVEGNI